MKENSKNIMRFELDRSNPPELSQAAKARLKQLETSAVNFSDIPELTDEWFSRAALNISCKKPISLRIDEDTLIFFKAFGLRYQTRINAVLRAYVNAQKQKTPPS